MSLQNVPEKRVKTEATRIESFLQDVDIPTREVEPVEADVFESRTSVGGRRDLPEFSVYMRVTTAPISEFDKLETLSGLLRHLRDMLDMMEMNGLGPDSMVVAEDHPPVHLDKPLVFFLESTM